MKYPEMLLKVIAPSIIGYFLLILTANAQNALGTGTVETLFKTHCAVCHGEDLSGAIGSSLVDDQWTYGSSDHDLRRIIENGLPNGEMTPWKDVLSSEQIRSLIIYIREMAHLAKTNKAEPPQFGPDHPIKTNAESFFIEPASPPLSGIIWTIIPLPEANQFLVANKNGDLQHLVNGNWSTPIKGTPTVKDKGQGGLMDIALHPDYPKSAWIYLSFSHELENGMAMTKIVRGKIVDNQWTEEQVIFSAPPESYLSTNHHFGSRIVFLDDYIYFSIGERGISDHAQNRALPNGKIHRLHLDGSLPEDNPFIDDPKVLPSIWSYGHRNPQGLAIHPQTKELWATEHGPRGGDELNKVIKGKNYGWPEITYGMNYSGTPITDKTAAPGIEQPVHYWVPSIAPCGIEFYQGDSFPHWKNNLFITGLSSEELHRLVIKDGAIKTDEIILKGFGRIRDVTTGLDGKLYLAVQDRKAGESQILKISPNKK